MTDPRPKSRADEKLETEFVLFQRAAAFYDRNVGEFLLAYDAVREAGDPEAVLVRFFWRAPIKWR